MEQTYIVGDIHGKKHSWEQVQWLINHNNQIILLGDLCDRGPDGYDIMKQAVRARCIYLKGNHEDMFCKAALELGDLLHKSDIIIEKKSCTLSMAKFYISELSDQSEAVKLSLYNGGMPTLANWVTDGCPHKIIEQLQNLPLRYSIEDTEHEITVDLCHSGCFQKAWINPAAGQDAFIWCRDHFGEPWFSNHFLIHGHTPCTYLEGFLRHAQIPCKTCYSSFLKYNNNKLGIDTSGQMFKYLDLNQFLEDTLKI